MGRWFSDEELEDILRNYPLVRAQAAIEAEELRHLFPSCIVGYKEAASGGELPDGTAAFAVRRMERSHNMRRARAIEIALEALTCQQREFVRLMYFEGWERYQIRLRMGVKRSHLFNLRRQALDKLAAILLRGGRDQQIDEAVTGIVEGGPNMN